MFYGVNLPPISHFWHWCRSTITYQVPLEKEEKTEYNDNEPEFKNLINKEEKQYSEKEIKLIANQTKDIANKYTENSSKWSGNIIMSNRHTTAKLWNCNIETESNVSPHAILHEQLHAHSISYYDKNTYLKYRNIEEATVELYTKEIGKKENIINVQSNYDELVNNLKEINNKIKIKDNSFDFAKDII